MNKASETLKAKYGEDYFKRLGAKGSKKYLEAKEKGTAKPRGYEARPDLASAHGRKGGLVSKRTKAS